MRSPALAVAVLFVAASCNKAPPPTAIINDGRDGDVAAQSRRDARKVAPNWAKMINKVRNLDQRRDKIIDLMEDSVSEYDHYKRSVKADTPDRKRLENAKRLQLEAGDLEDVLFEDVVRAAGGDDLGDQLWNKRLRTFQTKFDKLSKKVRRIEFK